MSNYKKKYFLTICCIGLFIVVLGQSNETLDKFNNERNRITKKGMIALGSWSAANIIYSAVSTGQTSGTTKYFHQMNVMWGGINLGIAALGYLGAKDKKGVSLSRTLKKQAGTEKIYLFNAGLDIAYISSGFYLKERARNAAKNSEKLKGYGESIILQGAALLLLDAVLFSVHNRHGKKLYKETGEVQLSATGNGLALIVKL